MAANSSIISDLTPVRRKKGTGTLTQAIYEAMLRSIIVGELAPGQFLVESDLARRFQTSRTPLREACISLSKEGLLATAPYKGWLVTEVSLQEMEDLFDLRRLLEPESAARAASNNLGTEFFRTCNALLDAEALLVGRVNSYETSMESSALEQEFHCAIARGSGNARLAKFMSEIMNQFRRIYYVLFKKVPVVGGAANEEHRVILQAIEAHDPSRARQLMCDHMKIGVEKASYLHFETFSP